jgi:thioredoxin-dependent peroxiredoxin
VILVLPQSQHLRSFTITKASLITFDANGSLSVVTQTLMVTNAWEAKMTLKIGETAPDFEANTTQGPIRFHEWIGDSWCVMFSHPKDFTPVCTTELGYMARIKPEFDRRDVKIIGLSVDPVDNHARWAKDIEETQGHAPNYPMIGDPDLSISKLYGMLPATANGDASFRTPVDNQTVRNVFVIGPDKKIKLILVYPMTTGRNFDEVLRVIDSLQLTAKHRVSTPVNWNSGEDVIIAGSVSNDEAIRRAGRSPNHISGSCRNRRTRSACAQHRSRVRNKQSGRCDTGWRAALI